MKPLEGLTVVDFTHGVAGPFATLILGDLGCEVIKLEMPGRGDPTRYMNVSDRFSGDIPRVGGDYFMAINRNKRSVTVNLKDEKGRDIAKKLVDHADVVVQNFRPGVMDRLGLGEEEIRGEYPSLIYASLTAYGEAGPLAHQPGMDVAVQARSGVMSITGPIDGDVPIKPGVSLADFSGGVHLAMAILAALYRRMSTGTGDSVKLSLLDSTMAMLINYSVAVLDGGARLGPMGSGHPQLAPFEAVRTSDGYIVIATGTNSLFREMCELLGRSDLASDARFASNESRVTHRSELMSELAKSFSSQSTDDWLKTLEQNSIPCAPVNRMEEALSDPQLLANGMVQQIEHPAIGMISQLASPYHFSDGPLPIRRPPPQLGEHTDEVLREYASLDDSELDRLRHAGVI